eukprot:CAMPEP_0206377716 /NCGR_PEP_ID=MMETSP0294-20121207/10331_1 /ASSEMBLY_ACC=CAM_ASM_000327 /TAXON_ID=39354 /ORGANISM="Heterosigma akashiwo, Strain CCMP2393" /LENGTH=85 /DNA_ID=CAMNT_0053826261 /DNA_START=157 /DNA_END=412 /DNA_ORIENTATION=+
MQAFWKQTALTLPLFWKDSEALVADRGGACGGGGGGPGGRPPESGPAAGAESGPAADAGAREVRAARAGGRALCALALARAAAVP